MSEDQITSFFESAIEKTKNQHLPWTRASKRYLSELPFAADWDKDRSFVAEYKKGVIMLAKDSHEDDVYCFVKPDTYMSYVEIGDIDSPLLRRLYNIVYSKFPSIESFIESFISD